MFFKDTLFLLDIKFQKIHKQWMGLLKERKFCQKVQQEKKYEKQAGAELGQAQLKLRLDFN